MQASTAGFLLYVELVALNYTSNFPRAWTLRYRRGSKVPSQELCFLFFWNATF